MGVVCKVSTLSAELSDSDAITSNNIHVSFLYKGKKLMRPNLHCYKGQRLLLDRAYLVSNQ